MWVRPNFSLVPQCSVENNGFFATYILSQGITLSVKARNNV